MGDIRRVLSVVHGRLRHEGIAVHLRLLRARRPDLLDHVWSHSPYVAPGRRPRADPRLRGMPSRDWMARMWSEHAVLDRRGCRRRVMSDMGELGLALKMRRQHARIHALALWRSAVLVVASILIGAAIEIRWALVLIWTSMLQSLGQYGIQSIWV